MKYIVDPRDTALRLVEDGLVPAEVMITACLKYMSGDDVRGMLSANGFDEDEEDEDIDDEVGDGMTDAEADADTLASAGWGTDEDYE